MFFPIWLVPEFLSIIIHLKCLLSLVLFFFKVGLFGEACFVCLVLLGSFTDSI